MFEENGQIIKIDGKDQFIDIREAFAIGKVCFQFRRYNTNQSVGNRITTSVDVYMDISEFAYFANIMKEEKIKKLIVNAEKQGKVSGYTHMSGNPKKTPVISRQISISRATSDKLSVIITGSNQPGIVGQTGIVKPDASKSNQKKYVMVGITDKQMIEIGLAAERAIQIYDIWVATRTLDARLAEIRYQNDSGESSSKNTYRTASMSSSSQNSGYKKHNDNISDMNAYKRSSTAKNNSSAFNHEIDEDFESLQFM